MVLPISDNVFLSGNPSIDYFVSADVMEPQNRTALSAEDEAYSEQVRNPY